MGAIHFSVDERLLRLFKENLPVTVFVETGTYEGGSLESALRWFPECHSIELSPELHAAAQRRFTGRAGLQLHLGSSPAWLAQRQVQFAGRPVLFWLDAHWCVAQNAAGEVSQCPLIEELRAIGQLHPQSVVLIDDARLYLCPPPRPHRFSDWPEFDDVTKALLGLSLLHRLMVLNDVLVFYPAAVRPELAAFAHEHGVDWLVTAQRADKSQETPPPSGNCRRGWFKRLLKSRVN